MRKVLAWALCAGCVAPTGGLDDDAVVAPPPEDTPPDGAWGIDVDVDTAVLPVAAGPAGCADAVDGWCEKGAQIGLGDAPSHGRGLLIADFDLDGWEDVFRCSSGADVGGPERSKLFMNRGDGTFYVASAGLDPRLTQDCWGVTAADVDQDRDLDLLVLPGGYLGQRPLVLYRNDFATTGGFTDVSAAAGLEPTPRWWWGGAFGDLDGDHCVDLVAVARDGRPSLYRSHCDGTFVEEGVERGLVVDFTATGVNEVPKDGKNPVLFDLDLDGDLDLFVAASVNRATLLRNDGGHFVDITHDAFPPGVVWLPPDEPDPGTIIFSASVADFDQDGWPDLFFGRQNDPDQVAFNQHDGTFRLLSEEIGFDKLPFDFDLGRSLENTMGATVADIDLNGYPDVLIGTGTMQVLRGDDDVAFCNLGPPDDGSDAPIRFTRCSQAFQEGHGRQKTHGIAVGDFDHDTRLDLMWIFGGDPYGDLTRPRTSAYRSFVYEDGRPEAPRIATVRVFGTDGDLDKVGTRLELRGSRSTYVFVTTAQGYQSTISRWLMLPMGHDTEAELIVRWPDGTETKRLVVPSQRTAIFQPGHDPGIHRLPRPPEATVVDDRILAWRPPRPANGPTCDPLPPKP